MFQNIKTGSSVLSSYLSDLSISHSNFTSNWAKTLIDIGQYSEDSHSIEITDIVNISDSIFEDNELSVTLIHCSSVEFELNNIIIFNNRNQAGYLFYSIYSSIYLNNLTLLENKLSNGGFYISGYDVSSSVNHHRFNNETLKELTLQITNCKFDSNLIAVFPLFQISDITSNIQNSNWNNNSDLFDTENLLFLMLQYTTNYVEFNSSLTLDNCKFIENTNEKIVHSNIISIDMITSNYELKNCHFINNTGNFPAIDILSDNSNGIIDNMLFSNNSGGIDIQGSLTIQNSNITGCVSSVLKVFGFCTLENVFIFNNTNPNLNEALIEVGLEVGNTDPDRTLLINNSTITFNIGSTGIIQVFKSNLNITNSIFSINNSSYITGCITSIFSKINFENNDFYMNSSPVGAVFSAVTSNVSIDDCNFYYNRAFFGGVGFSDETSYIQVKNSFFNENFASERGGCFLSQGSGYFQNNTFYKNIGNSQGGAISFAGHSDLIVYNSSFIENSGGSGGAISFSGECFPEINNSFFFNNTARSGGGAIITSGNCYPSFDSCIFDNNIATSIGGAATITEQSQPFFLNSNFTFNYSPNEAGGIHCTDETNITMNGCYFYSNTAGASGGAFAFGVSAFGLISHTTIDSNKATSKGGGIACYNNCYPKLVDLTLINNTAGSGAALWITDSAKPEFSDCTFRKNYADSVAGAILSSDRATGSISNCLFIENAAISGAGGAVMTQDFGQTNFENCTFKANYAQNGGALFSSADNGPNVSNSVFYLNIAFINGGGISFAENCSSVLTNINCTLNYANGSGGCIYISDIAIPTINNLTAYENIADGFGGGMIISDQSSPFISNSIFENNVAESGGGAMIEQTTGGTIENSSFNNNVALAFGGGILYQGSTLLLSNIEVKNNTASSGGGICIDGSTTDFYNVTICKNCTITLNRADRGGGIYVELSTTNVYGNSGPTNNLLELENIYQKISSCTDYNKNVNNKYYYYDDDVDDYYRLIMNLYYNYDEYYYEFGITCFTFHNATISHNFGNYGGGIYYYPSTLPTVSFIYPAIYSNIANRFGGGVYIGQLTNADVNNDAWIFYGYLNENHAFYAGYNVAWKTFSSSTDPEGFCLNCTVIGSDTNTIGYSNDRGYATAPETLNFINSCPTSVYLTDDSFDVTIDLIDSFGTHVNGTILLRNSFNITMTPTGDGCHLVSPTNLTVKIPYDTGTVSFKDITFQSKNNSICPLRFTVISDPLITSISPLNCKIQVYDCPSNYDVTTGETYDFCVYCKLFSMFLF